MHIFKSKPVEMIVGILKSIKGLVIPFFMHDLTGKNLEKLKIFLQIIETFWSYNSLCFMINDNLKF